MAYNLLMRLKYLMRLGEFPNRVSILLWSVLASTLIPITTYIRLKFLSNPLISEPHGRQSQTALTSYYFAHGHGTLFDYRSPLGGKLWNFVVEFPLYQWLVAKVMAFGVSIEVASRATELAFFIGSAIVFVLLVHRFFGKQVALWGALFYLVIPLNVLFSRAGLIDFPALFFMLCTLWLVAVAYRAPSKMFCLLLVGATVTGSLASTIKVTIWFCPAAASVLCLGTLYASERGNRTRIIWLIACFMLQLVVAILWMEWAGHIFPIPDSLRLWHLGIPSDRISPRVWLYILRAVRLEVLHDWLILPFFVGLFVICKKRLWLLLAATVILLPVLVLIRNHSANHDYYYLIEMPYLLTIAAIGMTTIFKFSPKYQYSFLAIISIAFAYRMVKLPYLYSELSKSFVEEMRYSLLLKKYSSVDDVVYVDESFVGGGLEVPLYSERKVLLISDHDIDAALKPSLFTFSSQRAHFSLLDDYAIVWVDGETDFPVYRVHETGDFRFDVSRNIASMQDSNSIPSYSLTAGKPLKVSTCQIAKGFQTIKTDTTARYLTITLVGGKVIVVPRKNFLSLPSGHGWGCVYIIATPLPIIH